MWYCEKTGQIEIIPSSEQITSSKNRFFISRHTQCQDTSSMVLSVKMVQSLIKQLTKFIFSSVWRPPCQDHLWPNSKSSSSPLLRGVGLVLFLLPVQSAGHQHLQTGLGLPGRAGAWQDNTTNFYLTDRALLHAEP